MDEITRWWAERHSSAKDTKSQATQLKKAGNVLNDAARLMREHLPYEDLETLERAATILANYQPKVEHAAEIKQREEHKRGRQRERERREAMALIRQHCFEGKSVDALIAEAQLLDAYIEHYCGFRDWRSDAFVAALQERPDAARIERLIDMSVRDVFLGMGGDSGLPIGKLIDIYEAWKRKHHAHTTSAGAAT